MVSSESGSKGGTVTVPRLMTRFTSALTAKKTPLV